MTIIEAQQKLIREDFYIQNNIVGCGHDTKVIYIYLKDDTIKYILPKEYEGYELRHKVVREIKAQN